MGDLRSESTAFTPSTKRWLMLAIYALLSVANAALWTTYSPISDIAQAYFGGSKSATGSLTAINMLATTYQILYGPGTLLAVFTMKSYDLRRTMLVAAILTTFGAALRLIGALTVSTIGDGGNYGFQLTGQCLAAIAQPLFLNLVTAIATQWFPLSERDLATTIATLFNPLGSAVGQIIPAILVTQTDDDKVHGMVMLLVVELVLCALPMALTYVYFEASPSTPPSRSQLMKVTGAVTLSVQDSSAGDLQEQLITDSEVKEHRHQHRHDPHPHDHIRGDHHDTVKRLYRELQVLFNDRNYMLLFVSFSAGIGLFNAMITLLNQILDAQGYSNDDAGNFGAVLIVCGIIGAGIAGYLMEKTHAYRPMLKACFGMLVISFIFFFFMLKPNNDTALLISFALLGFFMLAVLPVAVENAAEVSYPVDEEMSVGLLFLGGNTIGIGYVFGIQALLSDADASSENNLPWLPSNIFMFVFAMICFGLALLYHGPYRRLQQEQGQGEGQGNDQVSVQQEQRSMLITSPISQEVDSYS